MANSIPKQNIGKHVKSKKPHNLSHDASTTTSFGLVQPLSCTEVAPGDVITLKSKFGVRAMPMVVPTFGRILVKQYFKYVPVTDLYRHFQELLTNEEASSTVTSGGYTPTAVPSLPLWALTYAVLQFSHATLYEKGVVSEVEAWRVMPWTEGYVEARFIPAELNDFNYPEYIFDSSHLIGCDLEHNEVSIVTPDNADFIIHNDTYDQMLCLRLYQKGANLRKVLLGLGLQLSTTSNVQVNILPILGFYKAYFDTLYPKRSINWKSTPAYQVIDVISEKFYSNDLLEAICDGYDEALFSSWVKFIDDLTKLYYYQDADYFTASTDSVSLGAGDLQMFKVSGTSNVSRVANSIEEGYLPSLANGGSFGMAELRLARYLYNLAGSQNVFGKSVQAALRYRYNADNLLEADAQHVGSHQFMCPISDIVNTAESSYSVLGEFAGKSEGSSESEVFTFKQREGEQSFGYLYAFFTIVPDSGYCQGLNRLFMHRVHDDFYQDQLDALGMQPIYKGEYVASRDISEADDVGQGDFTSETFGLIPRMSEYKTQPHSIVNGDLSRRSKRSSMLPYTLDRWFSTSDVKYTPYKEGVISEVEFVEGYEPDVVSEHMRAIGLSGAFGNYDRIFVNRGSSVDAPVSLDDITNYALDNFICHCILEIKRISAMLPLSESFTEDAQNINFKTSHE